MVILHEVKTYCAKTLERLIHIITFSKKDSPDKIRRDVNQVLNHYIACVFKTGQVADVCTIDTEKLNNIIVEWNDFKRFLEVASKRSRIPVPIMEYKKQFKDLCSKVKLPYNLRSNAKRD